MTGLPNGLTILPGGKKKLDFLPLKRRALAKLS
jgi:hypothetical protein